MFSLVIGACAVPARVPPPTVSELLLQVVTIACEPLRAEITVEGVQSIHGLFVAPDCPSPERPTADCYRPAAEHPPCSFSCSTLTYWKQGGGTTLMHTFKFPLADDGTNSGLMTATVHLRVSTLNDTLIWEGDQSEDLAPLPDHRAGYFHRGLMEVRLDEAVFKVLSRQCLPSG
jgi:hypothetical protein